MCGENAAGAQQRASAQGSSPRVRGKHAAERGRRRERRLIPACAGKTKSQASSSVRPRAHPRVCGENLLIASCQANGPGSSPRVRGKHQAPQLRGEGPGLIPACAGKTRGGHRRPALRRAHPRVCGENWLAATPRVHPHGSSPRVRGKLEAALAVGQLVRLIPACAGKTQERVHEGAFGRAHPRVCGENRIIPFVDGRFNGSSPRVRGKPCGP